jgi:hypothetical protein
MKIETGNLRLETKRGAKELKYSRKGVISLPEHRNRQDQRDRLDRRNIQSQPNKL